MKSKDLILYGGIGLVIWTLIKAKSGISGLGNLPRKSCLECTQKHISAAAVLGCEVNQGYPEHRMLVIGHLNEAADESMAWPELSEAIREARKFYQQTDSCPDFAKLFAVSERIRTGA